MKSSDFGKDFLWGVSSSALQSEGAAGIDGKGPSVWDTFAAKSRHIKNGDRPDPGPDFYHLYKEDIQLIRTLNIPNFRFSLSWSRIFPDGSGITNQKGIDFYNRVIDTCLENSITPWVTLYHWDLPQKLSDKGGWVNRDILGWFRDYTLAAASHFGDRVKNWMILNEPIVFTGAGYFMGLHAPGKKGFRNFLPAMHHAALAQRIGLDAVRSVVNNANVGTTYSCSYLTPYSSSKADQEATVRMDALLNRLFIEPTLGLGYPTSELPFLKKADKYMLGDDLNHLTADFDFIGIQNYTRECVAHNWFIPYLRANLVPAHKRKVYHTSMNWEVFPEAIYHMIQKFSAYKGIKKIMITENGAAFHDEVINGTVNDTERVNYLQSYIKQVKRAQSEGAPIGGYFVWSLTDNFEWAEGYAPRFGLIHIDYSTQKRTVKDSGLWYSRFLRQ